MKTMYAASFKWGKSNLARLQVSKETEKSIWLDSYKDLIGFQTFNTPLDGLIKSAGRNDKYRMDFGFTLFESEAEALEFLTDKEEDYILSLWLKIEDCNREIEGIKGRLAQLKQEGDE